MDNCGIVTALLELLKILVSWPPFLVFVLLFFRKDIRYALKTLAGKTKKVTVGDYAIEFSDLAGSAATQFNDPALFGQILRKLLAIAPLDEKDIDAIEEDDLAAELPPDEEIDEKMGDEDEERNELESMLNHIRSH